MGTGAFYNLGGVPSETISSLEEFEATVKVAERKTKGQSEKKAIFQHALKNALLPVITVAGMEFGWLLGGAVVIETVFSINGVGKLIIESIRMKDVPQVTGCALFLSFFFMVVMLGVDILYAYIDPRIKARYQRG